MWVVASERVYYAKGDAGYGRAGEGAYMCENEARGDFAAALAIGIAR